jgi:Toprim-like/Protein of unknown function (DUF3991)
MTDPDELDNFKRDIDLRAFASTFGYLLDSKESWRGSAVMRHATGDKIVITRDADDGHFVYFSVRDNLDQGSIIDFVQFRRRLSLGAVRQELRQHLGKSGTSALLPELAKTTKDRQAVATAYAGMLDTRCHPYLKERAIPDELLISERFAGRIRSDPKGNVVFPHYDDVGVCGYELKNRGFKGFSAGGSKGLWITNEQPDDRCVTFCESAVDCLSYAALFPDPQARYASVGGQISAAQRGLIRAAIAGMPASVEVVAAMDSDEAGCQLARTVRSSFVLAARDDLQFRNHLPSTYKDWNDVLRAHDDDPRAPLDPAARMDAFARASGAEGAQALPERQVPPPTEPCYACGYRKFWRGSLGGFVCCRCTPPPKPHHQSVAEWWCVVPEIGEPWYE